MCMHANAHAQYAHMCNIITYPVKITLPFRKQK